MSDQEDAPVFAPFEPNRRKLSEWEPLNRESSRPRHPRYRVLLLASALGTLVWWLTTGSPRWVAWILAVVAGSTAVAVYDLAVWLRNRKEEDGDYE